MGRTVPSEIKCLNAVCFVVLPLLIGFLELETPAERRIGNPFTLRVMSLPLVTELVELHSIDSSATSYEGSPIQAGYIIYTSHASCDCIHGEERSSCSSPCCITMSAKAKVNCRQLAVLILTAFTASLSHFQLPFRIGIYVVSCFIFCSVWDSGKSFLYSGSNLQFPICV